MVQIPWLSPEHPVFPDTSTSLIEPSGLLAAGGNLNAKTLQKTYFRGIFPWFTPEDPILWWAPRERAIVTPHTLQINRSNRKLLAKRQYSFTSDLCFEEVVRACADRPENERWIDERMIEAYVQLHKLGIAHSLEAWQNNQLVGGLYGVQVGAAFCGESMFNRESNSSKLCFLTLANTLFRAEFKMIDCQIQNPFLQAMGVIEIKRDEFESMLCSSRELILEWPREWRFEHTRLVMG